MTIITNTGRKLAHELGFDSFSSGPLQVCSLLRRHASTYQLTQVAICNGPAEASSATLPIKVVSKAIARHEAWTDKRDEQLSKRIEALTATLVELGAPISGVDLGGDPRGVCVKLIRTDGRSNSWGGESRWCVPLEG